MYLGHLFILSFALMPCYWWGNIAIWRLSCVIASLNKTMPFKCLSVHIVVDRVLWISAPSGRVWYRKQNGFISPYGKKI